MQKELPKYNGVCDKTDCEFYNKSDECHCDLYPETCMENNYCDYNIKIKEKEII